MTSLGSDVSVVIPYYNREKYIDEAIQSVRAQTLQPLEIIIVNDCSRESSRRYLDRYQDICTIVDLPANVGLAGARNAGIRLARGKFIALLDDDDIWLPRKLEVQRRYLEARAKVAELLQRRQPPARNLPQLLVRRNQQVSISPPVGSSHPPAQLV